MPITNEAELRRTVDVVSTGLTEIQTYLGDRNHADGKVRFPRGYIRPASYFRAQLWFIRNETIKRNLAYAHLQSDALRWLLNRTDLHGTAKEMIIKETICLAAAISETITRQVCDQERFCGRRAGYKDRCDELEERLAIGADTCAELKWLWDFRQNEHIFLAGDWEYGYYTMRDCNRAIRALHSLKEELDACYSADIPF